VPDTKRADLEPEAMAVVDEDAEALQAAIQMSLGKAQAATEATEATTVSDYDSSLGEGVMELMALVTHKGRSADSGHYKAYVRCGDAAVGGLWRCFDDAKVTETTTEEVLRLFGNGDSDMAYLCFYRQRDRSFA
jgi:ubiquitin carboxyl-terminal hydrolase 14